MLTDVQMRGPTMLEIGMFVWMLYETPKSPCNMFHT